METIKTLWKKWKEGTLIQTFQDWKWILGYSKRYKKAIAFYLFLGIFGTVFGLVSAVASQKLIDIVTGKQVEKLFIMAVVMVGMALFSLIFNSVISRVSLKISIDIQNDIQKDIFEKIEDANWFELSKFPTGDILNRFGADVNTVATNAITWFPSLIVSVFNFTATFFVIFYYDHVMAFLALASAPVLLIVSQALMGKMREYNKRVKELNSHVMSFEQETFSNMNTIKSFGIADRFTKELKSWQKKYKDYNLEYNLFSIKTNIALSIVGMLANYAVFGWGVYRLFTGFITYGEMTLFITQSNRLTSAFSSMVAFFPAMLSSAVAAARVKELVLLPREKHDKEGVMKLRKEEENGFTIKMDQVDFSYIKGIPVIKESDFLASPSEIVALVGPSGEGKTTILRMILGLVFPEKGSMSIVSSSGNQIEVNADTREFFSYVPQGNTLFSGTIAENMRMVKDTATDEEIINALKISCAWDFVEKREGNIYSKLGENGQGVSEGQAQRLSIARAVLRNAPILLLDEATSALDVETERKVLSNIMNMTENKTCVVATHRPSVLSMCKRIYRVMDKKVTVLSEEEAAQMVQDF